MSLCCPRAHLCFYYVLMVVVKPPFTGSDDRMRRQRVWSFKMDFGELCALNMIKRRVERVNNGFKRKDMDCRIEA